MEDVPGEEHITFMAEYIETLENKLRRLENKFHALSTWLQSKFKDDSNFPTHLLEEADVEPNADIKIKVEPIDIDDTLLGSEGLGHGSSPNTNVVEYGLLATSTSKLMTQSDNFQWRGQRRKRARRWNATVSDESDSNDDDDNGEEEKPELANLVIPEARYLTRSITRNGGPVVYLYECKRCDAKFDRLGTLIQHMGREHPATHVLKGVWQCPQCKATPFSAKRLIKHLSMVHNVKVSRRDVKPMYKKIPPGERVRCLRR